jgi:ubiquinone biosynthesis protein UbiJ
MLEHPLNHLLAGEAWARDALKPFAGQIVEIRPAPLPPLRLVVREDGLLDRAPDGEPALVITLKPEAPAAFLRGKEHFLHAVEVSGNAKFADAVMLLARDLRWDFEEDLSRVVGDIAAHRIAGAVRDFAAWQGDAGRRVVESLADYFTVESGLLARRAELESFAAAAARLRDDLERLEQRVRRLG